MEPMIIFLGETTFPGETGLFGWDVLWPWRLRCGNVVYPISGIMEPSLGIFQVVLGMWVLWCVFFLREKFHGDFSGKTS